MWSKRPTLGLKTPLTTKMRIFDSAWGQHGAKNLRSHVTKSRETRCFWVFFSEPFGTEPFWKRNHLEPNRLNFYQNRTEPNRGLAALSVFFKQHHQNEYFLSELRAQLAPANNEYGVMITEAATTSMTMITLMKK